MQIRQKKGFGVKVKVQMQRNRSFPVKMQIRTQNIFSKVSTVNEERNTYLCNLT